MDSNRPDNRGSWGGKTRNARQPNDLRSFGRLAAALFGRIAGLSCCDGEWGMASHFQVRDENSECSRSSNRLVNARMLPYLRE
jgi:hypothetical protein